jgi:hypothetical protein
MGIRPDNTCLFIRSELFPNVYQPIVKNRCPECGELVDVLQPGDDNGVFDWYIYRVDGNSINGYGLAHTEHVPELKTPSQWEKEYKILIIDPDGWRMKGAPEWEDAITREDFEQRAWMSTIKGSFKRTTPRGEVKQ